MENTRVSENSSLWIENWKHPAVIALILAVSALHYLTPVTFHHFHSVYQRLYYLPILLACYHFGFRIGLGYALICGLFYAPHIFYQWSSSHDRFTQYLEIIMFLVVAGLAGSLFGALRRQQAELLGQQEGLRRAERFSLMGKLAAGLAHEIRNPLNSLLGAADIVRRGLGPDHPDKEFASILDSELRRINRILNEFLEFARPRKPEFLPQNLNEVVESTLAVVSKTLEDAGVHVIKRLDTNLSTAPMDAELIRQALLNLVLNAKEAMPRGGTLTLETRHAEHELILQVSDQGPGIAAKDADSIFGPFYTTKEGGTGLGLAMSRQIAELHKGSLTVRPHTQGACLEMKLPDGG